MKIRWQILQCTRFTTLLLVFLLATLHGFTQKVFSEGVIKYDVFLNNESEPQGIYLITIKTGFIKRELVMNSGYDNVIIFNHKTGTSISLNVNDDDKYALQLTATEVLEKNKQFEKAEFIAGTDTKKIAGYSCQQQTITYKNKEKANFYYTADLIPSSEHFNTMFPGLKGIPLEYEVKAANNSSMKFIAQRVEIKSIDLSSFDIPKDYKIVTKAELEKIK
ncbi:MAG: hypothetical protein IPI46_08850 [Bacteroidetes bacterium]|nr:hypothetical protein [Bacteroidota bacterium]